MKSFVILASVIAVVMSQRPGYLGSGAVGYPGLANRFKDDSTSSSTTAPDFNNRLGDSGSTQRIPIDARGDAALINRVNQWPREHRPFWVLNAEAIEAQRGGNNAQNQASQFSIAQDANFASRGAFDDLGNPIETQTIRPVQTRGSFAGK